jgi:nitroreductase
MPAIQLTERGSGIGVSEDGRTLARAAVAALGAPSVLNTQPWRWLIDRHPARRTADRSRQVASIDPQGRLLTMSCGIALHHARTALAAAGHHVDITYLPDDNDPDLLAVIRLTGATPARPESVRMFRAMTVRHSDRRPFSDRTVADDTLQHLRTAAEERGAHLHLTRPDQLVALTVAAGRAATIEVADPRYRADLASWVGSDRDSGDGVPTGTAAPAAARPVPIRDFTATGPETTTVFDHLAPADTSARYVVLFTDGDDPRDWLTAGEALSAVLLAATADGLATSMMSDLVEVESSRNTLRDLLGHIGHPMVVVRLGYASDDTHPTDTPRRAPEAVIVADDAPTT